MGRRSPWDLPKERSQGLHFLSTPGMLAQRKAEWMILVVGGPQENWGLTLLLGKKGWALVGVD